jgi:hypothetical protein
VEDATQAAPERIGFRLDWTDAYTVPALHANQALGQLGTPVKGIPDGIYLVLGSVEPPVIADEQDRDHAIEELTASGLKVKAQGRFHLSRETALEVIRILQAVTTQYEAAVIDTAQSAEPGA